MHDPKPINDRKDVFWIGVNDRDTDLFEGVWPLPRGVAYNSYLILDEKVALLDTVKAKSAIPFEQQVLKLTGGRSLDYLIINHMEPDHAGSIPAIMRAFPGVKLVGNAKTAKFVEEFFSFKPDMLIVNDGDTLDLGRHKLTFALVPMVHWPETMVTYDTTDGILFSMDAFGGFSALEGGIFDDEVDLEYYEDEALRYYANIVGRHSQMVQRAFQKLAGLDIKCIAPTHGPVWRRNPGVILKLYDRWSRQVPEKGIVLVYGTMYGNTERMMEAVARGITETGFSKVRVHDVSRTHVSYILRDAWRYKGLILGAPSYDTMLFPPMEHLVNLLEIKKLSNRVLGAFGSAGWSGGAVSRILKFGENNKLELVGPSVEAKFSPKAADIEACRQLGRAVAERVMGCPDCAG